jgi:threonine/homoserine/homoserine lactone efflux protein
LPTCVRFALETLDANAERERSRSRPSRRRQDGVAFPPNLRQFRADMIEPPIGWPLLTAFLLASLGLAAAPGPGVVYVVTRTVAQGRRAGLASVMGVALGNLGNAVGASVGLAALFALSSAAFMAVKLAGAGYLVYLGVKALRVPGPAGLPACFQSPRLGRIFRDGFVVALLNPKTAIFFAAFLPQFISPQAPALLQSVQGALFVLIAACTDTAYVVCASLAVRVVGSVNGAASLGRYATAAIFIGLGLFAAASEPRSRP